MHETCMQAAGAPRAEQQAEPLTFTDAEEAIMAASTAGPDAATLAALRQGTRASISRICRLEQVCKPSLVSLCLLKLLSWTACDGDHS